MKNRNDLELKIQDILKNIQMNNNLQLLDKISNDLINKGCNEEIINTILCPKITLGFMTDYELSIMANILYKYRLLNILDYFSEKDIFDIKNRTFTVA